MQDIKVTYSIMTYLITYSIQPRDQIFIKGYGFMSFAKNMSKNISKNIKNNI